MVRPLEETKVWGHDIGGGKWRVFWARIETTRIISTPEKKGKFSHKIRVFDTVCDGKPSHKSLKTKMFLAGQVGQIYEEDCYIESAGHAIDKMNNLVMEKVRAFDSEFLYFQHELQCIDEVNGFLDKYAE